MKHAIEQIAIYVSRMSGIRWTDIVEIIILSFLIYHILVWIKNTKAWSLLKGILVIAVFILFAAYFEMNTILWIVNNLFSVAVTAVVVILALMGSAGILIYKKIRKETKICLVQFVGMAFPLLMGMR